MGRFRAAWRSLFGRNEEEDEESVIEQLQDMAYAYQGAPFVEGTDDTSIDMGSMQYAYCGTPFVVKVY